MLGWEVIPGFEIGGLKISPHGIGIAIGYFVGTWLAARLARERGFPEDHIWNGALWGMVGAILGARVAYVAGHFDEFSSPIQMLKIWEGGISLVGGLIGGIGAGYLYARSAKVSFIRGMDYIAPGLAIGVAVGRIGDLLIGDHLGKETESFLGWAYKGGELISSPPCVTQNGAPVYSTADGCIAPGIVVHQTALYDMLWALVIFGILMWFLRRPRPTGLVFYAWGLLYALGRITTDFLRVDKTWLGLGLTGSQLTSIVVALAMMMLILRSRTPGAVGESEGPPEPREPMEVSPARAESTRPADEEPIVVRDYDDSQ